TCTLDDWTNSLTPGAHVAGPLRATLRSLGKPVALLPGNHDRYGPLLSLPPYPPGNPAFDGVFGGSLQAGAGAPAVLCGGHGGMAGGAARCRFPAAGRGLGALSVWFVSFGGVFSLGHYGQGRVYGDGLQRLRELTREARAQFRPCLVLWVVHFEPQAVKWGLNL